MIYMVNVLSITHLRCLFTIHYVELYIFITKQLDFNVFWHFRYHNQTFVAFSLVIVFLKSRSYIFFKNVEINNSNLTVLKPLMTPKKKKKKKEFRRSHTQHLRLKLRAALT